jgi:hypothetical protein
MSSLSCYVSVGYNMQLMLFFLLSKSSFPVLSLEEVLSYPPPYIKYSPYGTTLKTTTRVGDDPSRKVMLWEDFSIT